MHRTGRITAWTGAALLIAGVSGRWGWGDASSWSLFALAAGAMLLILAGLLIRWNGHHPAIRAAGAAGFHWRGLILAVLALCATVLVNAFSAYHYRRIDCSQGGLYSLSPQSLAVVEELRLPVRLLAFIRDPQAVEALHQMMERYWSHSDHIDYRIIDPRRQLALAREYSVESPTQAVLESPLGRRKIEILTPFQQWRPDNEQRITAAILRVGRLQPRKVYFLSGHGERDLEDGGDEGFRSAADALRAQGYQVETLSLAQAEEVPGDADVLIAAGPQIDFQPAEAELLKAYLRRGGRLMILVDPLTDFRMTDFLAPFGLALGRDLLLEDTSASSQQGSLAPLALLERQHPVTRGLSGGYLVLPSSQSVWRRASALGYQTYGLASTSPRSWSESRAGDSPHTFDPLEDRRGLHFVAVAAVKDVRQAAAAPAQARVLLAGDSDFAANAHFQRRRNGDFFLMAAQWLAGDAEVLDIPVRGPLDRRLNLGASGSRLLRWTLLAVLPALPLLAGLWTWRRRAAESASS